jgi:hypothetical protein
MVDMSRIKRLIDRIAPAPHSLADACGEEGQDRGTPPDVARRRQIWTRENEACCHALERDEPCTRAAATRCSEAAVEES